MADFTPKYFAYVKVSKDTNLKKVPEYIRSLEGFGYKSANTAPALEKAEEGETVILFTIETYTVADCVPTICTLTLEDWNNTKLDYPIVNCGDSLENFFAVARITGKNDENQYFVVDEDYSLGAMLGYVPKGSFSFCYEEKNNAPYKCHKASPEELGEYFLGSKRPIEDDYCSDELYNILIECKDFHPNLSPRRPSLYWLQKWLRRIHRLNIYVIPRFDGWDGAQYDCHYEIYKTGGRRSIDNFGDGSYSYEEALVTAIRECLEHHVPHVELEKKEETDDKQ